MPRCHVKMGPSPLNRGPRPQNIKIIGPRAPYYIQESLCTISQLAGMQILFVPERHHWVLSSCVKRNVALYDRTSASYLPDSLQIQLVQLYNAAIPPKTNGLLVECTPVQQQEGQYNCGLFTVAFAYHLAVGDVKSMALDQHKLQKHLAKCFERKCLSRFPRDKREVPCNDLHNINIDVFCACGRPDCWDDMFACDKCNAWFHLKCARLRVAPAGEWMCKDCRNYY